jgi:hypothetical protein
LFFHERLSLIQERVVKTKELAAGTSSPAVFWLFDHHIHQLARNDNGLDHLFAVK